MNRPFIAILGTFLWITFSFCNISRGITSNKNCLSSYDEKLKMEVLTTADVMPSFPGGETELNRFILKNFKYPEQDHFRGSVNVSLVIDRSGKIIEKSILDQDETSIPLKNEVIRVISLMPDWKPGECSGKKVAVRFNLPISW